MTFFEVKQIKSARKRHPCYWCGEFINVGDSKTTTAGVFEGDFTSNNFHLECYNALQNWESENSDDDYWPDKWTMKRGEAKSKGDS